MVNNQRLILVVAGGLFFGAAFFIMVLFAIDKTDDWETLLSGFSALGAAVWASFLLNRQIQQSEQHERDRNKRRFLAARATLPLALTQICTYCQKSCTHLKAAYLKAPAKTSTLVKIEEIPETVLKNIELMLETTPHDSVSDRLSDLVAMIQIFHARYTSLNEQRPVRIQAESIGEYISNCAAIYATASSLFDYSRNKTSFDADFTLEPLSFQMVMSAYFSFGMHSSRFDPIKEITQRDINASRAVNAETF